MDKGVFKKLIDTLLCSKIASFSRLDNSMPLLTFLMVLVTLTTLVNSNIHLY